MNSNLTNACPPNRRRFLKSILVAGVAPTCVPARVLGADGQTSPSGKINVGVIGVGAQGTSDMRGFLAQKDVRVTAICDVNQRNLANARKLIAEAYGQDQVKEYPDFRDLNADPSIDAVLMALPFHWHSIPALDAIGHGKHIYHEKPMALSFEESRRVRAAVRKHGVVFQFGTQQRSETKFRWACELALNGRLGKIKEIRVAAPGGIESPQWPEQPVPDHVDWNRWVGPAAPTTFHEAKLKRPNHENMTNFSRGMISCWGIHHMDIAQWGNGTDDTGPVSIQGTGEFPKEGSCDAILRWNVRMEYAKAAPVTFVNEGTPGFEHGIRFIGESAWVHVRRGDIRASAETLLSDPQNQCGVMPLKLPVSSHHTRNFLDAIKTRTRPICDVATAVRSDTVCQLALIAVKLGRKLQWDPQAERFLKDEAANAMLQPRPFRGEWKLPEVG
ncbi:MAG: Gfo/Idh/MocA family oxidoreductase [Verrucomicrobiota bacterium]